MVGDSSVKLVIGGDLYINRPQPSSIFSHLRKVLADGDIVVVNQEMPISDVGEPWSTKPNTKLRSPTSVVASMKDVGINAVMLATNHALDYGYRALSSTLESLDGYSILHTGAGQDIDQAHEPVVIARNGTSVAVLNYTCIFVPGWEATYSRPGVSVVRIATSYSLPRRAAEMPGAPADLTMTTDKADLARLGRDIEGARGRADLVVIYWHWGVTGGYMPSGPYQHLVPYQVELGHAAVALGADLVVGAGPHVLQGIEIHAGKPICYGIGEIGFDHELRFRRPESALLDVELAAGSIKRLALRPLLANGDGTYAVPEGSAADRVFYEMTRLSDPFGTKITWDSGHMVVEL